VIDSFENGMGAWKAFTNGASSIKTAGATTHASGASSSTEITYDVAAAGSAGMERTFDPPQDWSTSTALTLWVNGQGAGNTFLVQVYDGGNERWESSFKVDFTGWRQMTIPFSSLTVAAWQPPGARLDGVRDFGAVTGMSLTPSTSAGTGNVDVNTLAVSDGTTSASSGAGGAPATTSPTTSANPTTTTSSTPTSTSTSTTAADPTTTAADPTATPTTTTAPPTATPATTPTTAPTTTATPTAAAASASTGPATGTIIPLYTSPSDPSWAAVAAAKAAHPAVSVLAVVNPSNGPGGAAAPDYTAGISKLTAAGVKVIGYVHTSWGSRPASQLQTEMGQWKSWYPGVSGIFFDEMANKAGTESYYSGLTSYAKGQGFDFTIGNPGQDTSSGYVGTVDVILIYENSGVPAAASMGGWHSSYPRTNFGVIPYNVGSLDTSFIQMAKPYVGYIYMNSDNLPNPWDTVPSYLSDLVGALD
jgi:hypothetical protein